MEALKNLFANRDLSEAVRRRVELAVALAQERLLATHVRHALALVRLTGERLPYGQTVGIYTRVVGLTEDDARVVTTRALATLGEKAAAEDWPELPAEPEPEEGGARRRRTLLDLVKNRLRGRVDEELRRRVELAAARAEVAVLDAHVENSLEFTELLDGEMSTPDSVELYLDALGVREGIAEVVYYKTLALLADRMLPEPAPGAAPPEAEEPRLRVVDREGG